MQISLSKEVLGSLPAPDSQGLVRVQATLSVSPDGKAELMEIDGQPVGGDDEGASDDDAPMPSQDLPDLDAATSSFA